MNELKVNNYTWHKLWEDLLDGKTKLRFTYYRSITANNPKAKS